VTDQGVPLTRLYLFAGACALFAVLYGLLGLEPAKGMALLLGYGPGLAVAFWLAADSKRTRLVNAYDAGLFFYLTWPLTIPWYAVRTRGRAGWRLAAQLYALALAGILGLLAGAVLRAALDLAVGEAA
jgi:hypothetical protein